MTSTALKLKEHLPTNGRMTLRMKKRAGIYPSKFKPDEMQTLYFFEADGKEYGYYASPREEETLSLYSPGDYVEVVRQEKVIEGNKRIAFQVWGSPGSAEMTAAPQLQNNTTEIRQERQQRDYKAEEEEKWERIATSKILHNFMIEGYKLGKSPDEAAKDAVLFYNAQVQALKSLTNPPNES